MDNNNSLDRRYIRVFISSTFKDMAPERDYLMTKVFPRLQDIAAKRNVSILPLDLRWGITQKESESGKVLEICLREINNTRPFFIGLIGDRYGWCPSSEELQKNPYLREEFGTWLSQDIEKQLSITEIEFQYAILRRKTRQYAYFYERTGGRKDPRVGELKKRLLEDGRYPLQPYSKPQELGVIFERDFLELLDTLYPEAELSERTIQKAFRDSLCDQYHPIAGFFERLDSFIQRDGSEMVVYGDSGMGKSALVANWLKTLPSSFRVVYHAVGLSGKTDWRSVSGLIAEELSGNPDEKLADAISQAASSGRLILVLDGVDNLSEDDDAKLFRWLGRVPKGAKYIFTTTEADITLDTLRRRSAEEIKLTPLSSTSRRRMIEEYLGSFGKRLSDIQIEKITNAGIATNTSILKSLLDELISFGKYEELDQFIDYYLAAASPEDFFSKMIQRLEHDFGRKTVGPILGLIAFSARGITESEILAITGLSQLTLSQFLCRFRRHLMMPGGLVVFRHAHVLKAVQEEFARKEARTRGDLISFFKKDPVSSRAVDELPHQYFSLGKTRDLFHYLSRIEVYGELYRRDVYSLGRYWKYLLHHGFDGKVFLSQKWVHDTITPVETKLTLLNSMGNLFLAIVGDYSSAECYLKEALKLAETSEMATESTGRSWYYLSRIYCERGVWEEAIRTEQKALACFKKFGNEGAGEGLCLSVEGTYYSVYQKDLSHSLACHSRSLDILRKNFGDYHVETILGYYNVGITLCDLKRYSEALDKMERALKLSLDCFGEDHESTAMSYYGKGYIAFCRGDYLDAIHWMEKSLRIRVNIFVENDLRLVQVYEILAGCYQGLADWVTALEYWTKCLNAGLSVATIGLPFIDRFFNMGVCMVNCGAKTESSQIFKQMLGHANDYLEITSSPSEKARIYSRMGQAYLFLSKPQDAENCLKTAISIWEAAGLTQDEQAGLAYNYLGKCYSDYRKDFASARDLYSKAYSILSDVCGPDSVFAKVALQNYRAVNDSVEASI